MSTTITVDADSPYHLLRIEELTIRDDELVEFLSELDEDEQEVVSRARKIGVTTLQLAETSKELEYVRREFDSMQKVMEREIKYVQADLAEKFSDNGKLSRILEARFRDDGTLRSHIEAAFGEDGVFSERLNEELGENGERLQQALDPDVEGTPTYRMKQALKDEIETLSKQLTTAEAQEELRRRTTLMAI